MAAVAALLMLVLDVQKPLAFSATAAAPQGLRGNGKDGSAVVRLWGTAECAARFPGLSTPPLTVPISPETERAAAASAAFFLPPLPRQPGLMPRARHAEIPVFLHVFNNPTFVGRLLAELDCYSATVVLVDSASTFAPAHALLAASAQLRLRATGEAPQILQLDQNLGPRAAMVIAAKSLGWPAFFAFTDADLALNPLLPPLFLETLANLTLLFPPIKVALNLERESRPEDFLMGVRNEPYFVKKEPRLFFNGSDPRLILLPAVLDSTFAVYDGHRVERSVIVDAVFDQASRYITPSEFFEAVAVAGTFNCEHLPWRKNFSRSWTADEARAVFGRDSRDWSSSSNMLKGEGIFSDDE